MMAKQTLFNHARKAALFTLFFFAVLLRGARAQPSALAPAPVKIHYAKGLAIEYRNGYRVLRVLSPWRGARTQFTYILVPIGAKAPPLSGNETLIRTPIKRFVITTTVYIPALTLLGLEDKLIAIANGRMISTPSIAKRYADRKIVEIGTGEGGMPKSLNMELLMNLSPDLVMLYGTGNPTYDFHEQLHSAGIPFAINGEYMESSPLGAAEWIKFIAAFFDKDAEAERVFSGIENRYEAEAARARKSSTRPSVFSSVDYRGVWYMPGGKSYRARFFEDAGAHYLWDEDQSEGSMPLTMEAVVSRAKGADFWVDPGSVESLVQLAGLDERYRILRPFKTGQIYNNDVRRTPGGGNDFWESGMAKPDVILNDLISIFHPELTPGYQRVYYRKLPARSAP